MSTVTIIKLVLIAALLIHIWKRRQRNVQTGIPEPLAQPPGKGVNGASRRTLPTHRPRPPATWYRFLYMTMVALGIFGIFGHMTFQDGRSSPILEYAGYGLLASGFLLAAIGGMRTED